MTKPTQIVVAFDFTRSSTPAVERALAIAAQAPTNVLHCVCVLEPHATIGMLPRQGATDYEYASQLQALIAAELEQRLHAAAHPGNVHFFVHVRIGKPADEILQLANELGADMIIIGTKGLTGVEHLVLGSVAEKVVRGAGCSVEVARAKTYSDVELVQMVEVEPSHRPYVPPHRYAYEDRRVQMRPKDWPLF
ncbi:MAG: universal stress protein [Kofleriaceae bacterium]|nr:universal stress protein [Kofleriaceae bacterium]